MSKRTAIDAFLEHKARIDRALERLQTLSEEHFETHPDDINWADAGSLERMANDLEAITDYTFNEGECA